jgi:hypothetical protein
MDTLPELPVIEGLRIEKSVDAGLLSQMSDAPVDNIHKRLANDHVAFVAFMHNKPAAFGWMARKKAGIGELNHDIILPAGNSYLWNFRTAHAYRGLGIYPALLQYIIRYEQSIATQFWIIHAPENRSSLRGILKAGFRNSGVLYLNQALRPTFRPNSASAAEKKLIKEMGFGLSEQPAASCWNCSSPFIKNKTASCCCAEVGSACVGYRQPAAIS